MTRSRIHSCLLASLLAVAGCGDDGVSMTLDGGSSDGGRADVDAGITPDGGTLAWEALEPPSDGPLGIWGFMVARLDDARTVVIGGATFSASGAGGTATDGTWLYEATAEGVIASEIAVPSSTGPRYCGCAAWDPVRRRVVLVGGRDDAGVEHPPETWELDLDTPAWTRVEVPETPPPVVGCGLAYAEDRGALYLFGGGSQRMGFSDRTYRYDPSVPEWVALDATGPGARYDMAFVSLGPGKPLLMHAGSYGADGVAFFSDVWLFDPMSESWSESVPSTGEGQPRRTPWLVRDPDSGGFLVGFGNTGLDPSDALADLAHYDLTTGEWSDVTPPSGPGPHGFTPPLGAGAFGVAHLFGGYDNVRVVGELWRLARR